MPYPFHILQNEKLAASSHDVETFIRHALGQHAYIVEKTDLDETNKRYQLHFWQRDLPLDRHMSDGKIGKTYWGGAEIVVWSDSTEIVRMWAATPDDWYIGEFHLDRDKVMEERFRQLEELSNEIRERFMPPTSEDQEPSLARPISTFEISEKKEVSMPNNSEKNDNDAKRNVFVVHGRNEALRRSIFDFLRAIGLNPIEWTKAIAMTGEGSPFIGVVLDKAMEQAQAIVVLFTGDDEAKLKDEFIRAHDPDYEKQLTPQARPNVLFEAGMAFGKYPERTILVQIESLRPFSDIAGRYILHLTDSLEARQSLAHRLETAGCSVDITGVDWHSAGKFSGPVKKKRKTKETKSEINKQASLIEQVAKEHFLPVEAVTILIALTELPKDMAGEVAVTQLSQSTKINPLRTKKYCKLLESKGFMKEGSSILDEVNYLITAAGETFLLQNSLV